MKPLKIIILCLTLVGFAFSDQQNQQKVSPLKVVTYYPLWSVCTYEPQKVDWKAMTHFIWFTSEPSYTFPYVRELVDSPLGRSDSAIIETGGSGITGTWRGWCYNSASNNNTNGLTHLSIARDSANSNNVKFILCAGGEVGTNATIFNWIIADTVRQDVYIAHMFEYMKRKGFKGIDLNIEYPLVSQKALNERFLLKWREKLNSMNPPGWLSFTAPAWYSDWVNRFSPAVANATLDGFLLMAYGMGAATYSGFNAPLARPSVITYPNYNAWTLDNYGPRQMKQAGYDSSKIVMLIPFETAEWSGVDGPGQLRSGLPSFGSYSNVLAKMTQYPSSYRWDNESKVPWLGFTEGGVKRFISYEDSISINEKVKFARSHGISGVGVWELWRGWVPNNPAGKQDPLLQYLKKAVGTQASNTIKPKIKGQIFFDKNSNGVRDINEPGVAGWKVYLQGLQSKVLLTDAVGIFSFDSLITGSYTVSIESKPSWQITLPNSPGTYSVSITTSTDSIICNFGLYANNVTEVSLSGGWNLVSLPVKLQNTNSTSVFPTAISSLFSYSGSYSAVNTLEYGKGYFTKFNSPQTLLFAGDPFLIDTVDVNVGWNLVGSVSKPVPINKILTNPLGITTSEFYTLNQGYQKADTIKPGYGYWIKISEPGVLILNANTF